MLCPRLAAFRTGNRQQNPTWFNGPVPEFGKRRAALVIVGLAPGLRGANRTGRPFTGDYAGDLLYATLKEFGFARGEYREELNDGLELVDTLITNAVRCVPPENKPTPLEIRTCNQFLLSRLADENPARVVLALGRIAHEAVLTATGDSRARFRFQHGARHVLQRFALFDSYHCSRYNTNTGRLTAAMFRAVFERIAAFLSP